MGKCIVKWEREKVNLKMRRDQIEGIEKEDGSWGMEMGERKRYILKWEEMKERGIKNWEEGWDEKRNKKYIGHRGWNWEKKEETLKVRSDEGEGKTNWEEGWDKNKSRRAIKIMKTDIMKSLFFLVFNLINKKIKENK